MSEENIDLEIKNQTERDVIENFRKSCLYDPFPSIPPALLNHSDIKKYIYSVGILFPYYDDKLTGATYKIPLLGDIYYWEKNDKNESIKNHIILDEQSIKEEKEIILKRNSITYIHISTTFRVPYYLVYRFNLTVSLAHKGLLLGTGPIIDPGFEGRIMIPIHNLTANNYTLKAGESLIRVEFTKLSPISAFDKKNGISLNDYKYQFPENGKHWDEYTYFDNIYKNKPIISSIPDAMNSAKQEARIAKRGAQIAKREAKSANNTVKLLSIGAAITLFVAIGSIVYSGYSLIASVITPTISLVDNQRTQLVENANEIKTLKEKLEKLEKEIFEKKNEK